MAELSATVTERSRTVIGATQVHRIVAVVVTYNPDQVELTRLLAALLPQVAHLIIVDNASSSDVSSIIDQASRGKVELLQLPENNGIASAQNSGIKRAMDLGADFVLLSDQDSVPSASMVAELLAALRLARSDPVALPVAAVGPATVDRRTRQISFFVTTRRGIPRRWQPPSNGDQLPRIIEVEFLIASGSLIPIEVIKHIGAMRSNYFIDHVDTEWCFRAKGAGYRLLGVPASILEHQLGDSVKRVWFFGTRQVMYHSPLRDYYMFRNTLLMLRDASMPWVWRVHLLWRLGQFAGYFLVFVTGRWLRLRRMSLGIVHAFRGVSGRLDATTNRCAPVPLSAIEPPRRRIGEA